MTERQHDTDRQPGARLSTADMAAAGERRTPAPPDAPARIQDDAVPIEAPPQPPQMAPASAPAPPQPAHVPPAAQAATPTTQAPPAAAQATTPPTQAAPASAPPPARPAQSAPATATSDTAPSALLPAGDTRTFRSRWDGIQTGFVDEPRQAVEQADGLVAEVMQHLAGIFADERAKLESQWSRGDDVSTEDLRIALRRYRSFFDRLLSM